MTAKKVQPGRRRSQMDERNPGELIDPIPIEMPAGIPRKQSVSQQIQTEIAIQISKKQTGT